MREQAAKGSLSDGQTVGDGGQDTVFSNEKDSSSGANGSGKLGVVATASSKAY
jgi:hypothetical protein